MEVRTNKKIKIKTVEQARNLFPLYMIDVTENELVGKFEDFESLMKSFNFRREKFPASMIKIIDTKYHDFTDYFLPRLKTRRKLDEQTEISDSISATVVKTLVIPANFTDPTLEVNYFVPRFKKIVKGEEVEWQNQDSKIHHLKFYDVSDSSIRLLFDLGKIEPNHSIKKKFAFNPGRIDYLCTLHRNEVGSVIIYPKPEDEMTNAEQIRFLSKIFDIRPPASLAHLRYK